MPKSPPNRPELLAPAGDWDAMRAAVANGANAVYFGLSNFNARHRATNFTIEELPDVMAYLHRHNVRGYVAFNTLIFTDELLEAERFIAAIAAAGADAVIVQDLGLVRLIRRVAPGLSIHGSTQMTLTESRGIEFVRRLGVERVIVARELSMEDIGRIVEKTPMPLEVFIHGALCVAYSGQCLTSEALGGRSANRGQCAQACRLPYELVVDGKLRDTGDRQYLLSPQDLAAHDLIEPLVKLGVSSFKIEGRLKSAEYVAITSQTYRAAIDAAVEQREFALDRQQQLDLQQSFSRGFSHGFLSGANHQVLVPARFPKSRGVHVGAVAGKSPRGMIVELADEHELDVVKPGDGLVFDEGHPEQDEQGGRVVEVRSLNSGSTKRGTQGRSREIEIIFYPGSVNLAAVSSGALVWKTDDPRMRRRLEQSYARDIVPNRDAIHFSIRGAIGGSVELEARDAIGNIGHSSWAGPLQVAQKHPVNVELLREQLGRLGDTPFELGDVESTLPVKAMLPKSVLNDLRRRAIEQLLQVRDQDRRRVVHKDALDKLQHEVHEFSRSGGFQPPKQLEDTTAASAAGSRRYEDLKPTLTILCRTMEQLDAVLAWRPQDLSLQPAMVYCDFEDVRRYHDAVEKARAVGTPIGLATLRITKPHEEGLLRQIAKAAPEAVLIRNLAGLVFFQEHAPQCQLIGDFSLNITNELTADLFRREKLARLTPGYDLNWDQLKGMLARIDPGLFEVVVHQHMPMFHMEHCVFAAMLSDGKDYRDCGRPCDHHKVELRDRVGAAFPLLADTGCRNTVFNSVAQSAAEYIPQMLKLGVRHFRVELVRENAAQVGPLLEPYAKVIAGLEQPQQAWRNLQVLNQLGVTRGTLQLA